MPQFLYEKKRKVNPIFEICLSASTRMTHYKRNITICIIFQATVYYNKTTDQSAMKLAITFIYIYIVAEIVCIYVTFVSFWNGFSVDSKFCEI